MYFRHASLRYKKAIVKLSAHSSTDVTAQDLSGNNALRGDDQNFIFTTDTINLNFCFDESSFICLRTIYLYRYARKNTI